MAAPQIVGLPQDNLARSSGILGVQQEGENKYRATFANGQQVTLTGDAGRRMFERYQAGAPAAPPPTQQVSAQQAPQAAGPPSGPPSTAAPANVPPQLGPLGYSMEAVDSSGRKVVGQAVMTPQGVRVYTPGSRGSPGGMTDVGKSMAGKMAATEREVEEARQREQEAQQEGVLLARTQAAQERAFQEESQYQATVQAQEKQSEVEEIERRVADKEVEFAKAKTAFVESRVDPERYMRGNWLAGLGMALGSFGATLGRTQNFAQEYVQSQIARDIRAQELAIELKGKNADNALADLKTQLGSLGEAKAAYKQFMTEAAGAKLQSLALRTKDQQLAAAYNEQAAKLQGIYALQDQERRQRNLETLYKDKLYYRQGTAGSSGGYLTPTQEAIYKRNEEKRQGEELRLKQQASKEGAAGGKIGEATKKSIADIDASIAGLDNMEKLDAGSGSPYLLMRGGSLASDESQQLTAAARALGPGVARAIEGDAATKESMEAAREGLLARSADERARAREQYRQQLLEKRKALLETQ